MTDSLSVSDRFTHRAALHTRVGVELAGEIELLVALVRRTLEGGGKLLFCGNGGSAADAQHLAAEYVVRYRNSGRPLPALALTTDSSVMTAVGNDMGFEALFARQVEALGREGDLLLLHSTSGESENLIQAARKAREFGIATAALLARTGGRLAGEVELAIVVPTDETALAQEVHLAIGHEVCERVERTLRTA